MSLIIQILKTNRGETLIPLGLGENPPQICPPVTNILLSIYNEGHMHCYKGSDKKKTNV